MLDDLYIHKKKHNFITATFSGIPSKYEDRWSVFAPIVPLIQRINEHRKIQIHQSDFLTKIMCDSGQGKAKVCLCIIPLNIGDVEKKERHTYKEGGILAKGSQCSGINKCIMCFCAPEIKEHYWNMEKIFDLIKLDDVLHLMKM